MNMGNDPDDHTIHEEDMCIIDSGTIHTILKKKKILHSINNE
jgi:hypothetical protein